MAGVQGGGASAGRRPCIDARRDAVRRFSGSPILRQLAIVILGLSFAAPLAGQGISTGRVRGVVNDTTGQPMGNVRVALTDRRSGFTYVMRTPRAGVFTFAFVPPGDYDLLAEQLGYLPVVVRDITVVPQGDVRVAVRLEPADPPVMERATSAFDAAYLDRASGGPPWGFGALELRRLPDERRDLASVGRFSSIANGDLVIEGLPASLSQVSVDGIPIRFPRHPLIGEEEAGTSALPILGFERAVIDGGGLDVEWSDYAGGRLAGQGIRGSNTLETRLYADWAPTKLSSSKYFDPQDLTGNSFRGGALLSGPIIRDTAHFVFGVDVQRLETALPPAWESSAADTSLLPAADSLGVDLAAYRRPRLATSRVASGFGRFDWQANRTNRLTFLTYGSLLEADDPLLVRRYVGLGSSRKSYDVAVGANFISVLGSVVALELRAAFETGRQEYFGNDTALTLVADGPVSWGTDPALPGRFDRTGFRLNQTFHVTLGAQQFKVGGAINYNSYRDTYAYNRVGSFVWGSGTELLAQDGAFRQTVGREPIGKFSTYQFGGFVQDRWTAAAGADLIFGFRVDWERVDRAALVANQQLFARAGIVSDSLDATHTKFSPRLGFIWDVANKHRWVVRIDGGVYQGAANSAAFSEAVALAGANQIREGTGTLSSWPAAPDSVTAAPAGALISVLPYRFSAPKSLRATLGISGSLGAGTQLHLSGAFRHTDFLTRRRDLNRVPGIVELDQYNRPVYGQLEQRGAVLAAAPGSNRRLADFSVVSALNQDGVSDYLGITARIEHRLSRLLGLSFGYTYSRTTDNVPGLARGPDAQLSPFPDSLNGVDWDEGTSDFDVPNRAVFGAELNLRVARIAGFFRYESGIPFTPGFRDGVDANGDGSWRNDPAYVDDQVTGVSDLFGSWDCLRTQVGRFAERNSCRGPARKSLDLRVALGPFRIGYPVELVIDAMNVLDAENADVDRALYLVDGSAALVRDPATGTVTVPLVANPDFGRAIRRYGSGRYLRIGLRVNYD